MSPVAAFLRPTAATMSPVNTSSISSRWLACMRSSRPIRSFFPVTVLSTVSPLARWPE